MELTLSAAPSDDPWVVTVPDVPAAQALLDERTRTWPRAARVLDDVLRLTDVLPVADGLVVESLAYSMLLGSPEFASWRRSRPVRSRTEQDGPAVLVDRVDDVLTLTLNRPERHNAFSREVRDALLEGLDVAVYDEAVRVELRGRGASFCSGGDLDEFGTASDLAAAHEVRIAQSAGRRVHEVRDRTTAYLHGACIGAGLEVPAFAGRVVAHPDAVLQLPELSMGLVPGAGGTVSVARRIGRWRTAWMVLSGARVDAATALAWGLVDEVRRW